MRRIHHIAVCRSGGATLAEVLVALLILSVGLLGIAALYVDNLRSGRTGLLRTQAANLAADMAERIRTNQAAGAAFARAVVQPCTQLEAGATPEVAAENEVACWQDAVAETLPNGLGTIVHDPSTRPPTYTVTVSWFESGTGTASYVLRVQA